MIELCDKTGLIYLKEIPFTRADIIRICIAMSTALGFMDKKEQFVIEPSFSITDKATGTTAILTCSDVVLLQDFMRKHQFENLA